METAVIRWHDEIRDTIGAIGRRLFDAQVNADDVPLPVGGGAGSGGEPVTVGYGYLRRDPGPHPLVARRGGDGIELRTPVDERWHGPFRDGDLLRLSPASGVRDPARTEGGITFRLHDPPVIGSEPVSVPRLISVDHGGIFEDELNMEVVAHEPQVAGTYYADAYSAFVFAWMADHLDLRTAEPDPDPDADWDLHPDPRHESSEQPTPEALRAAAGAALDFVVRTYPEYQPAKLDAFGHSDFKNPPFLEAVEDHLGAHVPADDLARWRAFYGDMVNTEGYSPTNVHALRAYWWARRNRHWTGADDRSRARPAEHLAVVRADQTADGLIADNVRDESFFGGSTDNHDLTYHLYALSWVARSVALLEATGPLRGEQGLLDGLRDTLVRGARFSTTLTTPAGECSYAGRSANNAYHLTSAMYALSVAAAVDPVWAPRHRRAVRLTWGYLRRFRDHRGDLPLGLNEHADQRMGWSHCQTPYSAANAYFLAHTLAALDVPMLDAAVEQEPLPLEVEGIVDLTGSRYAGCATGEAHLVVFAGCARSPYPHSGLHNTGTAGIAVLGASTPGAATSALLPILEQSLRDGDWSTSDLADLEHPDGTVVVPDGAGDLRVDGDALVLTHRYGGIEVCHRYRLVDRTLEVQARVSVHRDTDARVVGLPAVSVRTDSGCRTELHESGLRHVGPHGGFELRLLEPPTVREPEVLTDSRSDPTGPGVVALDESSPDVVAAGLVSGRAGSGGWEVQDPSSTGRGLHRKVARPVPGPLRAGTTWRARWEIEVVDAHRQARRREVVDNLPPAPTPPTAATGDATGVPPFVLRKLYRKGSLRRTEQGIAFTVRNPLVDVHLGEVVRVVIDDEVAAGPVTLRLRSRPAERSALGGSASGESSSEGADPGEPTCERTAPVDVEIEAADLSVEHPVSFPKDTLADVHVAGVVLEPGRHDLELALWITEIGPIELVVSDELDGLHAPARSGGRAAQRRRVK